MRPADRDAAHLLAPVLDIENENLLGLVERLGLTAVQPDPSRQVVVETVHRGRAARHDLRRRQVGDGERVRPVPLLAPAEQGLHSVELANAMLYSSLTDSTIELPLDGTAFETKLNQLIQQSSRPPKRSKK